MTEPYVKAPGWRTFLAGLLDLGITWPIVRQRPVGSVLFEVVREQVGSPGERLMGVRTVDPHTGRRVALRPSLLVAALALGSRLATRSLAPASRSPEDKRALERYWEALRESENATERERLRRELPAPLAVNPWRALAPVLTALVMGRVRRRFTPRVQVLARRR